MIRPLAFGFNPETSESNPFQNDQSGGNPSDIAKRARKEFDEAVRELKKHGIEVVTIEDTPQPPKPDAVFPNNWLVSLPDGPLVLCPVLAENRRTERRMDIPGHLQEKFFIQAVSDISHLEKDGLFLEGTGSVVLDHNRQIAYACLSPRTSQGGLDAFERASGYQPFVFAAEDLRGEPIYHTNMVLSIGETFAIVCADAIPNSEDRVKLIDSLIMNDLDIIPISRKQMEQHFAGNCLQLISTNRQRWLVMSRTAYESLDLEQIKKIKSHCGILPIDIPTIEKYGGGSARCMLCEIFA